MRHPNAAFPESIMSEPVEERVRYFSNKFLRHENLNYALAELKKWILKTDQAQIINVVGPTGVGKTELAKTVLADCYKGYEGGTAAHSLPMVYVEVPLHGRNTFDWKDLFSRVYRAMQGPPPELMKQMDVSGFNEGLGRQLSLRSLSESGIREKLEERIDEYNIRGAILDEVQHLFKFTAMNTEKSLDILKNLANTTGCQIILIGTYESLGGMNWSGQLMRRTINIHFARYDWRDGNDRRCFVQAYAGLLAYVPFDLDEELLSQDSVERVYLWCCGCIGVLKELIERAILHLSDSDTLTIRHLNDAAMSPRELRRLAQEIIEGEKFFEQGDINEVGGLLGLADKTAGTKKRKPKAKVKGKPGERAPVRDLVGV